MSERRPPLCNSSSEAGALPSEVRIENDSDRKFLSPKFKKYFLETTFLYVLCYSDHYEPKIFFRFFLEISFSDRTFLKSKYFKSFPGNYFCSLFMFHATLIIMSRKFFFRFSKFATTLRYTILDSSLDSRGFP